MVNRTSKQLKIDVTELRDGKTEFEFECDPDGLSLGSDAPDLVDSVRVEMSVFKTGDEVDVEGSVSFACYLECSRCLKRYKMNRTESITAYYRIAGAVLANRETELSGEDTLTYCHDGKVIDLTSCIRDAMLLSVPMKPLCSPECEGLCSICGQDLNERKCLCSRELIDARWEALKKFKH